MSANALTTAGHLDAWPPLPLKEWEPTRATLHMWTQMAGKIRLALTPLVNHYWSVTLYVNSRGLTTSPIPYGDESFEMQFDFIDHKLVIAKCNGETRSIELGPKSVANFYVELMAALRAMGIEVKIWPMPVEIANPIRFDQDRVHASYDREYVSRFWRVLLSVDETLKEFRTEFIGKVSPVHFFWGSFDLCVTRFSGRRAPERPGADKVTKESYSHEVISVGFWPGNGEGTDAVFYAYSAPQPAGFPEAKVLPSSAFYDPKMAEYFLSYQQVRNAASPRQALLDFARSTYVAGATLGNWDRPALERTPAP
jgi:hypothetical protein